MSAPVMQAKTRFSTQRWITREGGSIAAGWRDQLPWPSNPVTWPTSSKKAPHCSNRSLRWSLLQFWFALISLPSEVKILVMCMSAHQVPIKDDDASTFWGTSLKDGRIQSQVHRCLPSFPHPLPSRSNLNACSVYSWSLAFASVSLQPHFLPSLPHTTHSSLTEVSAGTWMCHDLFCLLEFAHMAPRAWSLGISFLSFKIHSAYMRINNINLNMTDNVELLK